MKKLLELEKIHELYPTAWLHGRYLFKDDIFDFYVGSDSENWTSEPKEIRGIDSQKFDLSCHFVEFFISLFFELKFDEIASIWDWSRPLFSKIEVPLECWPLIFEYININSMLIFLTWKGRIGRNPRYAEKRSECSYHLCAARRVSDRFFLDAAQSQKRLRRNWEINLRQSAL